MTVTIDIKQDARYQQGVEETARRLLSMGLDIVLVQKATNLSFKQIEDIKETLPKTN